MNLTFAMRPDSTAIIRAEDKQQILQGLSTQFAHSYGVDGELVLERLEEREALGSTGFGRGVAIPHARMPDLKRPVAALLKLEQPTEFAAADGLPVELVFGLLSPESSGAMHLQALASISRLVRDEAMRDDLIEAPNAEAMYALLTNATDRDAA